MSVLTYKNNNFNKKINFFFLFCVSDTHKKKDEIKEMFEKRV